MLSTRNPGLGLLLMLLSGVLAAGCPRGDVGATLLVSPEVMNFGTTRTQMLLTVNKNITSTPADGPVVVTSSAPWIIPERCGDVTDDCNSRGPFDKLRIPIRVDRSLSRLGMNTGILSVHTRGTAIERVTVHLEDVLQADFSVNMREVDAGQQVTFTDETRSSAEAGLIVGRQWDFGDGGTSTATNPNHTYTQPGIYDVSLTITTPTTVETFTRESYITVRGVGPAVAFEGAPTVLPAGNSVTFTDQSTSTLGTLTNWFWQFGDGGTSRVKNPVHTYELPGVYAVSLSASTQFGTATLTKSSYITVLANLPGVAEFTHEPLRPRANQPVNFFDLSNPGSTPIMAWLWNFGDGQTSVARDPVHTFTTAGIFDVSLTITTALGDATKVRTVVVTTAQALAESKNTVADSDCAPSGESAALEFLAEEGVLPVVRWSWDFGDGTRHVSFDEGQPGAMVHVLPLDAQQGPASDEIADGSVLVSTVSIAVPDRLSSSTALLFVHGESLASEALPNQLASLAVASGSVVALVDSVPGHGAANAIARAMDTVQSYLGTQPPVDGFILIDAAGDGRTTSLEGVSDCRVHAVAPIPVGILTGD